MEFSYLDLKVLAKEVLMAGKRGKVSNMMIRRWAIWQQKIYHRKLAGSDLPGFVPLRYAQGGYAGIKVTGMIEWRQNSGPKKIPKSPDITQKNPWIKKKRPKKSLVKLPLNCQGRAKAL